MRETDLLQVDTYKIKIGVNEADSLDPSIALTPMSSDRSSTRDQERIDIDVQSTNAHVGGQSDVINDNVSKKDHGIKREVYAGKKWPRC